MDPKSFAGKPPTFEPLTPEFGAKLSEWILGDMRRAKKAREERRAREDARAKADAEKADPKR